MIRHDHHIPQAPGAWPGIGHAIPLIRRRLEFMTSLAAHGDIVRVRLGRLPAYVVTHPDLVWQVLVPGDRDYQRGRLFDKLRQFAGDGLASTSGEMHRRHRRMLQPAFRPEFLTRYADIIRTAAETEAQSWIPGRVVAIDQAMNRLTQSIMANTLFGTDRGAHLSGVVARGMPVLMQGMMVRTVLPTWWEKLPTPGNRRYARSSNEMNAAIDQVIADYRSAGIERDDLLSALLAARDDNDKPLSDRQIRDQVITFILAGIENPSVMMAWALYEISRNPAVAERVHAELDTILAGRPPGYDDMPELGYLDRVVTETLRVRAPWLFMRRTLHPVQLGDVVIPAGVELIYSPYALQHDPRWFPDPYRFDPDRWLPENRARLPKGANVPFSAGTHKCIGDTFAVAEMVISLAVICTAWRLRPLPGIRVREVATASVHPSRLLMITERRDVATGNRS
jgi:cytochrome P450